MAKRRVGEINLNYDSITDLITNLAGGLILIVLLLNGLARKSATRAGAAVNEVQVEAELAAQDVNLQQLNEQIHLAQAENERLRREATAKQPRDSVDPKGIAGTPAVAEFRPAMETLADKPPRATFLVIGRRVYPIVSDFLDGARKELETDLRKLPVGGRKPEDAWITKTVSGGCFDLIGTISAKGETVIQFKLKPDAKGESAEEVMAPGSDFSVRIARSESGSDYVKFFVYPDSFETFRTVRGPVFTKKLNYSWMPVRFRQPIGYAPGAGADRIQ